MCEDDRFEIEPSVGPETDGLIIDPVLDELAGLANREYVSVGDTLGIQVEDPSET